MLKTLVSLNADLASRIALRYTCQMAKVIEMDVEAIHVEEADTEGNPPGTGWVREGWKKGLLETASDEIYELIRTAREIYPVLRSPKLIMGEHDDGILHELMQEQFDLLIEGTLLSFNPSTFEKRIHSALYKNAPCPILLVKNLVTLKGMVLLLEDQTPLDFLIPGVAKIVQGAKLSLDLLHLKFVEARLSVSKGREKAAKCPQLQNSDILLSAAKKTLASAGWVPEKTLVVRDDPLRIADSLQDYGLVVSCLPRSTPVKRSMVKILSRVGSAVLLFRQ